VVLEKWIYWYIDMLICIYSHVDLRLCRRICGYIDMWIYGYLDLRIYREVDI
jgi:hypothetical protein